MKLMKYLARIGNGICCTEEMEDVEIFLLDFFPKCFNFSFPKDIVHYLPAAHLSKNH